MATKSFLKDIEIRNQSMGRDFARAIEISETSSGKNIEMSRKCTELKGESVKVFFTGNNE